MRFVRVTLALGLFLTAGAVLVADVNPAAISFKLPQNIRWVDSPAGSSTYVVAGDPAKPGLYIVLTKWSPHHMSRPHFHPNDRYITVLSGVWWVGTGNKYDPDSTVPLPAGSVATNDGNEIHYEGAIDVEADLE